MRTIEQWLDEYNESHQNRINKTLHWICVPLIVLSLLGLLWSISLSAKLSWLPFDLNVAIVFTVLVLIYYSLLSLSLTLGMLVITSVMLFLLDLLSGLQTPLWLISVIVFVLGWIGHFIGHQLEGKRPSFFKDIQFLLIGPLWLLSFVYRKSGIPY
jgi:uncharacterized membrane protein YGL010W